MTAAVDRIETSRMCLLAAMTPTAAPNAAPRHGPASDAVARFKAMPLVAAVLESVESWWSHHPLRSLASVAGEASGAVAKPIADRHPFALVLTAAAVGAALAWSRPWRLIFRSALFAGVLPQLASRMVAALPLGSWMTLLGSALAPRQRGGAPSSAPSSTPTGTQAGAAPSPPLAGNPA